MAGTQLSAALDNLSLGYALTYLIGLVSLIVGARYLPKLQHRISRPAPRPLPEAWSDAFKRKVYLPVIRAYRVGPELVPGPTGKPRELGIHRQTGCYIERIRRNGILANRTVTRCSRWAMTSPLLATGRPRVSIELPQQERSVRPRPAGHAYRHRRDCGEEPQRREPPSGAVEADRPRLFQPRDPQPD
ncbi:MAG: hypothetical protein ACLTXH_06440 [Enterobacter hormaechei]